MSRLIWILICAVVGLECPQDLSGQEGDKESRPNISENDLLQGMIVTPRVVRSAAASIEPSLVTIESFGGVSTKQGRIGGIRSQGEGNTTGVVISSDGYVITSLFNFIQQPKKITIKTSDGVRHVADVMGRDATRNICILKIENVDNLVVPEFADPSQIRVGQWAISVGVGFGDENTAISTGIISAKNRIGGRAIQTDANISPANYGGPLLDIEGKVIGICVPLSPSGSSAGAGVEWYDSGIGFAVPVHGNESLIERMKNGESIEPGYIGIRPTFLVGTQGAVVEEVIKDSPAEKAKVKKADLIIKIDDHIVLDQVSMRQILNRYFAGDKVKLTIKRKVTDEPDEPAGDESTGDDAADKGDGDSVDEDGSEKDDNEKDDGDKDSEDDVSDAKDEKDQAGSGDNQKAGEESDQDTDDNESDANSQDADEETAEVDVASNVEETEVIIEVELAKRPENNPEDERPADSDDRPDEKKRN